MAGLVIVEGVAALSVVHGIEAHVPVDKGRSHVHVGLRIGRQLLVGASEQARDPPRLPCAVECVEETDRLPVERRNALSGKHHVQMRRQRRRQRRQHCHGGAALGSDGQEQRWQAGAPSWWKKF